MVVRHNISQHKHTLMKKLFIAISFVLAVCSCTKEEPKDWMSFEYLASFGWDSSFDPGTNHVKYNMSWGGRGWWYGDDNGDGLSADLSDYDRVVVELDNVTGKVGQFNLCVTYATTDQQSRNASTIVDGHATLRVDLDSIYKKNVKNIYVQCDSVGEMNIKRAYLEKHPEYGPAIELVMDNGVISSDQFEGYSDKARVDFTFNTIGDIMGIDEKNELVEMKGWGVGVICSIADVLGAEVTPYSILLTNIGEETYSCELGDLRYMLAVKDDDGECGLFWTVWPIGNITEAHVIRTTISEVVK